MERPASSFARPALSTSNQLFIVTSTSYSTDLNRFVYPCAACVTPIAALSSRGSIVSSHGSCAASSSPYSSWSSLASMSLISYPSCDLAGRHEDVIAEVDDLPAVMGQHDLRLGVSVRRSRRATSRDRIRLPRSWRAHGPFVRLSRPSPDCPSRDNCQNGHTRRTHRDSRQHNFRWGIPCGRRFHRPSSSACSPRDASYFVAILSGSSSVGWFSGWIRRLAFVPSVVTTIEVHGSSAASSPLTRSSATSLSSNVQPRAGELSKKI